MCVEKMSNWKAVWLFVFGFVFTGLMAESVSFQDSQIDRYQTRMDSVNTLNSFQRRGAFFSIDYQGDYQQILQSLNNQFLGGAWLEYNEIGCSLTSAFGDTSSIFTGRNFDNPECQALLGRYTSPGNYSSLAICRMSDLGLPLNTNFDNLTENQKLKLLKAPFFATDGINETGLSVGVAYHPSITYTPNPEKESIFITLLLRLILDQAQTCEEALEIANSYNVFDSGVDHNIISHHLLVADRQGHSCVLEFSGDQFHAVVHNESWQVLTNSVVYNVSETELFQTCWRYNQLWHALQNVNGDPEDWLDALEILSLATWGQSGEGTQWSTIADLNHNGLYVAIQRNFANTAYVDLDSFEFVNYGIINVATTEAFDEDGNGDLQSGENIQIVLNITADFNTTGITAVLSSGFNGIGYVHQTVNFPDITAGTTSTNFDEPFIITVPDNLIDHNFFAQVTFTTEYGHSFTSEIIIPLDALSNTDQSPFPYSIDLKAYPNPFNPVVNIAYQLDNTCPVRLEIFNLKGQKVCVLEDSIQKAGQYQFHWKGQTNRDKQAGSGIYFIRLTAGERIINKKILMIK